MVEQLNSETVYETAQFPNGPVVPVMKETGDLLSTIKITCEAGIQTSDLCTVNY